MNARQGEHYITSIYSLHFYILNLPLSNKISLYFLFKIFTELSHITLYQMKTCLS